MVHVVCFNVALVMVLWVASLHDDDVDEDDGDDYDVDDPIGTGVEGKVAVLPSVGTRFGDLQFTRALGVSTWAVLAVFVLFACIESSLSRRCRCLQWMVGFARRLWSTSLASMPFWWWCSGSQLDTSNKS